MFMRVKSTCADRRRPPLRQWRPGGARRGSGGPPAGYPAKATAQQSTLTEAVYKIGQMPDAWRAALRQAQRRRLTLPFTGTSSSLLLPRVGVGEATLLCFSAVSKFGDNVSLVRWIPHEHEVIRPGVKALNSDSVSATEQFPTDVYGRVGNSLAANC